MPLIVRKMRLQRGWTQDQLAEFAGLSVRSVQRVERGAGASLETLKSLAAVFEVEVSTLQDDGETMSIETSIAADEKEAIEYVKGIREFYQHAFMFALFASVFLGVFGSQFGLENTRVRMMMLAFAGWGIGLVVHGLVAYEFVRFLSPKWERALIERRLGRKL
jgi:XRE family transcriptional regulator, regulator of sulfur utilization